MESKLHIATRDELYIYNFAWQLYCFRKCWKQSKWMQNNITDVTIGSVHEASIDVYISRPQNGYCLDLP